MQFNIQNFTITVSIPDKNFIAFRKFFEKNAVYFLLIILSLISIANFIIYYQNGLGLAYNDARSHLDIGRRVVENLKPGFAQLGSVWLPLPHLLMTLTIWNDFMWHSGLSGALQSMIAFIVTGVLIYLFLLRFNVGLLGRIAGLIVYILNINILYMQSTPMTELILLGTMTLGVYELMMWHKEETILRLVKAGFWIMLSTLVRYDGWFLYIVAAVLIFIFTYRKRGYKAAEGNLLIFGVLGGFGIFIWVLWNQMIFKDALYFIFGPYSADAQQKQMEAAGRLATKHHLLLSTVTYFAAIIYNTGIIPAIAGIFGAIYFFRDKAIDYSYRFAAIALLSPIFFNILSLYLGHSSLFVQGISSPQLFNIRYGLMMVPAVAIFFGYFVHKLKPLRPLLIGLLLFVSYFSLINQDAITIADQKSGTSGFDVSQVTGWLHQYTKDQKEYILISAGSHDPIMFSSGLPMSRFIHEGTGKYWDLATKKPSHWVRWIVMRSSDNYDHTYRLMKNNPDFKNKYFKVGRFPYADVYELKPEYAMQLHTVTLTKK